jgi:hypothetical protein
VEVPREEVHRLVDRLEEAARLRLEREGDPPPRGGPESHQVRRVRDQRARDPRRVGVPRDARRERARHGADAPLHPLREERGEDVGQLVGVGEPLRVEPVGEVDRLLDRPAVERAVREAVDREDVEIVRAQERPQLGQRPPLAPGGAERARRRGRQAQPHAERRAGGEALPDRDDVAREVVAHLRPALAGVDVGAVGEVRPGHGAGVVA